MTEYIERKAAIDACFYGWNNNAHDCAENIRLIPASDVRPVVRGKWIEHYEPYSTGEEMLEAQYGYECSICGRWEYEKEPFCNCGAMMEES